MGIEEMRRLEDTACKKTLSDATAKVFIINEIQEIATQRAQKNILDLLEKELPNTYFFLTTMDNSRIDKALKARCTKYNLNPLSIPEIVKYLMWICEQEKFVLDTTEKKKSIITIADCCGGSLRDAVSYLERTLYLDSWNIETLMSELSIISNENLNEMINQLLQGDINLLNNKITDDILKRMKFLLNLIYKLENGLELNTWQKQQIAGIKKCNINNIEYTIAQLNELNKFTYLPSDVIEFQIINIINHNKSVNILSSYNEDKPQVNEVKKERTGRR
jgi:DNA polymerase III gamma/tau subunit